MIYARYCGEHDVERRGRSPPPVTTIAPNIASPTSPRKLSSSQVDMAPISKDPTRDKSRSPLDVSSDSVHCNALTQSSTVSYAFSCHTIDTCGEEQDVESLSALPPPHSHPWVHVFSKSSLITNFLPRPWHKKRTMPLSLD